MEHQMTVEGTGTIECMTHAAAVMLHLGNWLLSSIGTNKKFRITIECDPEIGRFTVNRDFLIQQ